VTAPTYPPQQPYQPQFPQAPGYPQQQVPQPQYAPPQQFAPQQFAPQPYPQQYAAPQFQAPMPPAVTGTLDDFYNQPSTGGGKSLAFEAVGTSYIGIVTRAVGNGDIQQQTDTQGRPQTYRDGRPKFVMRVPLQLQPSPQYPDGLAQWYVKGAARDELVRAMAEAGAPEGPPEAGAVLQITFTGTRASGPGMNPTKLFQVVYRRPDGAAPTAQPQVQQPVQQQPVQQTPAPQPQQQFVPPAQPQQPVQQMPAPQAQQQPTAELTAEQQALLAKLTGGQPTG
jgi:hypothetical protein